MNETSEILAIDLELEKDKKLHPNQYCQMYGCYKKPVLVCKSQYGTDREKDIETCHCCEECYKKLEDIAKKFAYIFTYKSIDPDYVLPKKRKYNKRQTEPIAQLSEEELLESIEESYDNE